VAKDECVSNGGRIRLGMCEAKWEDAKKICKAQYKYLYSLPELEKIILNCGGTMSDYFSKWSKKSYEECYEDLSFSPNEYWTSSDSVGMENSVYVVRFLHPGYYIRHKESHSYVVCTDEE
jgi:hypothetical protein